LSDVCKTASWQISAYIAKRRFIGAARRFLLRQVHCIKAQLGSISASTEISPKPAIHLRSAKIPIMAALSVENFGSENRHFSPASWQAAANCRRNALLQATPPEAVTHRFPRRRAARTVLATSTSTMAACTLAHTSRNFCGSSVSRDASPKNSGPKSSGPRS
jgi:hypothetical protein